jgi:hypothetical protein
VPRQEQIDYASCPHNRPGVSILQGLSSRSYEAHAPMDAKAQDPIAQLFAAGAVVLHVRML